MLLAQFDQAIDAIATGALSKPILRLLDMAAHVSCTSSAMLICRKTGEDYVVAQRGMPFGSQRTMQAMPGTDALFKDGPIVFEDASKVPAIAQHVLVAGPAQWRWIVMVPVHVPGIPQYLAVVCGDRRVGVKRSHDMLDRLRKGAEVLADELELITELVHHSSAVDQVGEAHAPFIVNDAKGNAPAVESPLLVSSFLFDTLVAQQRLLRRGTVSYHAVRRWRSSLKPWQLRALKRIKEEKPPAFVEIAAKELVEAAESLHGCGSIELVTNVACGHSGPGCMAQALATKVASLLRVPYQRCFDDMAVVGSSHPKRNVTRPAQVLCHTPQAATLLIDDVATTGTHIAEATLALRQSARAVFPLAWLAA